MALEYIAVYYSYLDYMAELSDAECGRLFKACLTYGKTGTVPELRGNERFVWPGIKSQIDRDTQKYKEKCGKLAKNFRKDHSPDGAQLEPNWDANGSKAKEKAKEKEKVKKEKTPSESKRKVFSPPTAEEVRDYCQERKNGIDANAFVDFYAAKGWLVGKTPMRDWQAAVRTWEAKRRGEHGGAVGDPHGAGADSFHGWRAKSALDDAD